MPTGNHRGKLHRHLCLLGTTLRKAAQALMSTRNHSQEEVALLDGYLHFVVDLDFFCQTAFVRLLQWIQFSPTVACYSSSLTLCTVLCVLK